MFVYAFAYILPDIFTGLYQRQLWCYLDQWLTFVFDNRTRLLLVPTVLYFAWFTPRNYVTFVPPTILPRLLQGQCENEVRDEQRACSMEPKAQIVYLE